MSDAKRGQRALWLLLFSASFLLAGLLFDQLPHLIDWQIKRTLELATNEQIQQLWSKPPVDINSYYWLYDLLNADDFLEGQPVRVRKVGPFHFTSRLEKEVLEVSESKFRIRYNSTRRFHEPTQAELAKMDKEPALSLINPLFVSVLAFSGKQAATMDDQSAIFILSGAQRFAERHNESLIMRLSARQQLLGRPISMMSSAKKLLTTLGQHELAQMVPSSDSFGLVAIQNGSWLGPFEVYTGYQASQPVLGEIVSFRGQRRLTHFRGRCNRIQVSAGELRPMPLLDRQILEMYHPLLCHQIELDPIGEWQLREGRAIGYRVSNRSLSSAHSNPDNRCYCQNTSRPLLASDAGKQLAQQLVEQRSGQLDASSAKSSSSSSSSSTPTPVSRQSGQSSQLNEEQKAAEEEEDYCSLDGVIELAPCAYGAPILISVSGIPLDQKITSSIHDWQPDLLAAHLSEQIGPGKDEPHGPHLLILRRLGVPLKVDLVVTVFVRVRRDARFRSTRKLPEVSYVPLVTVREIASFPAFFAQIIASLESFLALSQHLRVICYLCALLLLLCLVCGHQMKGSASQAEPKVRLARQAAELSCASPARLFSQVDSLRAGARDTTRRPLAASRAELGAPEAAKQAQAEPAERGDKESEKVCEGGGVGGPEEAAEPAARRAQVVSGLAWRRNWLVRVCGRLVHKLDQLRSSLGEAGQLDAAAHQMDQERERQLAALAGRIEHWQRRPHQPHSPGDSHAPQAGGPKAPNELAANEAGSDNGSAEGAEPEPREPAPAGK